MKPQRYKINRRLKDSAAVTNGLPTKRCCRPSVQGNIFKVGEVATFRETYFADQVKLKDPEFHKKCYIDCCKINQTEAVALHKLYMEMLKEYEEAKYNAIINPCKNKNLGCFCNLDEPCHVDYLLKIANQ